MPAESHRECPSCGNSIPDEVLHCPLCKSRLGVCPDCGTWLVAGTSCLECGKTAVVPEGPPARPPEEVGATYAIEAPPAGMYPYLASRLVLSLLFVVLLAEALSASGAAPVGRVLERVRLPVGGNPFLLGGLAAVTFVLLTVVNTLLRAYRVRHTVLFGRPLQYRRSAASVAWGVLTNLLILGLTAGLGLPWIHARNRRLFYASCAVPARNSRPLGFAGTGEDVLGRFLLTLLVLPLAVGSAGILAPLATWIWVQWEHSHLLFPDRFGRQRPVIFEGGFGGYWIRALGGWFLSLLTLGFYRPWALAAEWRWIAAHSVVDDTHRDWR